jgi:DNA uptake protein ComE-like DNA-binding protein
MWLKEFFYFHRSDRKVIITLLVVAAVVLGIVYLVSDSQKTTPLTEGDSLAIQPPTQRQKAYPRHDWKSYPHKYYKVEGGRQAELFPFDPNTADSTELLRLGLQPWQVRNVYKYRAKGGIYRQPTDFARLYGLTQKQYKAMEPYIQISSDYAPAASLAPEREEYVRDTVRYPVKLQPTEHIALNGADTTLLKKVPGIGSGFARRIVSYGQRLGGYYKVEQLREIEGFPEEALSYFVLGNPQIQKININKLSLNQLKAHPYISFFQAQAIIDYRRLKGPLKSLDDLRLHKDFSPEAIERLRPYVEY